MTDFTDAPDPVRRTIRFDPTRGERENDFRDANRHSQRVRWLKIGLQSGDMKSCDTFKAQQL